jgi:hypothetical protein
MKISFEDYLQEVYTKEVDGTEDAPNDDVAYDEFCDWLAEMQVDTLIKYADLWAIGLLRSQLVSTHKEMMEGIARAFESHDKTGGK